MHDRELDDGNASVPQETLRHVFVHAHCRPQHAGADVGHARELQQPLHGAVLAEGAVKHREHHQLLLPGAFESAARKRRGRQPLFDADERGARVHGQRPRVASNPGERPFGLAMPAPLTVDPHQYRVESIPIERGKDVASR